MQKRFIILVDFSAYSANLIRYASDWSRQINAEMILVHQSIVFSPALADNESKRQMTQYTNDEILQKMKKLTDQLIPSTVKFSYSISDITLQSTINKLLKEPFDNLIITGLKGTGILKKIFLGTVALQVIDNTKNIVVAMPGEIDRFSHEKIFVGVTKKHPLNNSELNKFLSFLDRSTTQITFFYLAKPNENTMGIEKALRNLSALYADRFNTDFAIYEGSDPFSDIKKLINNKIDELLVVQKGSRMLTDQLFRRFLINELVHEGQTPLIVLP